MRLTAILATLTLVSCGAPEQQETRQVDPAGLEEQAASTADSADPVAECIARGVAYFKEIGSYPTLSSAPNAGRSAEDVAGERCSRTITAF